jgi:hypothetical protein
LTDKTVTIAAMQCSDACQPRVSIDSVIDIGRCADAKDTPAQITIRAESAALTTHAIARITEPSSYRKNSVVQILPENGRHRLSMTKLGQCAVWGVLLGEAREDESWS